MMVEKPDKAAQPLREELIRDIMGEVAAAGLSPAEYAGRLRKALKSTPDPARALSNYGRFLRAGFTTSLVRDFHSHPVLETIFLQIVSQSQYLADILCRTPELLHWLTASNELTRTKSADNLTEEALQATAPFERKERKLNALKRFHRREMLRLGAREILDEAPHAIVAAELSALADAVLGAVLRIATDDLANRIQRPFVSELAVIGLGKLGGSELNFSSDIDLMFVYENDEEFHAPIDGALSLHQIYSRLGETILRMLTDHTEEGYLYRVDMRLRPDGASGPIAMSRSAYLSYYESRGEMWERQMLLKARIVTGNSDVGTRFLEDIRPFVYPRSHTRSPLAEIASIKKKIEQKVGDRENIKLGSGGIRDIEFIVQALQLIHAGAQHRLRMRGTLPSLHALALAGILPVDRSEKLREAYEFFRRVEHRLQLLEGRQTHSLPETNEEFEFLARRLGYDSSKPFRTSLKMHRARVKRSFDQLFSFVIPDASPGMRTKSARRRLDAIPADLLPLVEKLQFAIPSFTSEDLAKALKPHVRLIGARKHFLETLNALASTEAIRRTLVAAAGNPRFFELLLRTCVHAPPIARLMMREPLFFESIAGMPALLHESESGWEFIRDSEPGRFKAFNEARIILRWLGGIITVDRLHEELTLLADEMIAACMKRVESESRRSVKPQLVIIALGKAGGRELTVGADLDLLFIDASEQRQQQTSLDAIPRDFLDLISTGIPPAYRVDLRLRPEGKNSPIVCSLAYIAEYFRQRAQLWERQSLLRARAVWGPEAASSRVMTELHRIAYERPLPSEWLQQLADMRSRIERERGRSGKGRLDLKTGEGGLLDVEFAVQALQLAFGDREQMLRSSGTCTTLERMITLQVRHRRELPKMLNDYRWLRSLELVLKVHGGEFKWPPAVEQLEAVATAMKERTFAALDRRLQTIRTRNRKSMLRIFATHSNEE